MTIYDHRTTFRAIPRGFPQREKLPDTGFWDLKPVVPKGEGWVMCGSAANAEALFWFWERELHHGAHPVQEQDGDRQPLHNGNAPVR